MEPQTYNAARMFRVGCLLLLFGCSGGRTTWAPLTFPSCRRRHRRASAWFWWRIPREGGYPGSTSQRPGREVTTRSCFDVIAIFCVAFVVLHAKRRCIHPSPRHIVASSGPAHHRFCPSGHHMQMASVLPLSTSLTDEKSCCRRLLLCVPSC